MADTLQHAQQQPERRPPLPQPGLRPADGAPRPPGLTQPRRGTGELDGWGTCQARTALPPSTLGRDLGDAMDAARGGVGHGDVVLVAVDGAGGACEGLEPLWAHQVSKV